MQLLLIRNARPQSAETGRVAELNLSYDGNEQARRLPDALSKFSLARIVSSPQLPARQTAAPVADQLRMTVDIDERFAEYDFGLSDNRTSNGVGQLPDGVDAETFVRRVRDGIDGLVSAGEQNQTVAVFTHCDVINAVVHSVLRTEKLLGIELDYAGVTRLVVSEDGALSVASVNVTEHVWDVLYRTQWWTDEH